MDLHTFKDVALQFLGNLFEYILTKKGQKLNILGATSGDTGSLCNIWCKRQEKYKCFYALSCKQGKSCAGNADDYYRIA